MRIEGHAGAIRLVIFGEAGQPGYLAQMSISIFKRRNKVLVERARPVGFLTQGVSAVGALVPTSKMHDLDLLTRAVATKFIDQLPEWFRLPVSFVQDASAEASGMPTLDHLREMARMEQEATVVQFIDPNRLRPLDEPMGDQRIREDISRDGWISAKVAVDTEEMLDSSRNHFPDLLAEKVTGDAEKFTDVDYSFIGEWEGQMVYRVKGKVRNFQDYIEDQG